MEHTTHDMLLYDTQIYTSTMLISTHVKVNRASVILLHKGKTTHVSRTSGIIRNSHFVFTGWKGTHFGLLGNQLFKTKQAFQGK